MQNMLKEPLLNYVRISPYNVRLREESLSRCGVHLAPESANQQVLRGAEEDKEGVQRDQLPSHGSEHVKHNSCGQHHHIYMNTGSLFSTLVVIIVVTGVTSLFIFKHYRLLSTIMMAMLIHHFI